MILFLEHFLFIFFSLRLSLSLYWRILLDLFLYSCILGSFLPVTNGPLYIFFYFFFLSGSGEFCILYSV